ncbi:hypothetical protein [Morganella psychrotolerans]|uniref:Uncharacterized protein n=1 Tax=Morganella psychrotolerans TaxID=368603 RepID=A0A1B8HEC1_9GAMM|nr:hypothetical protein [Morganella psychrotolerans]OBU07419.1 hypothetical protein AYY17_05345 [Morganella psychrotolerans]
MSSDNPNPLRQKSFKFIMAGMIVFVTAMFRLFGHNDLLLGSIESLIAIGLIIFGFKLQKNEKNK